MRYQDSSGRCALIFIFWKITRFSTIFSIRGYPMVNFHMNERQKASAVISAIAFLFSWRSGIKSNFVMWCEEKRYYEKRIKPVYKDYLLSRSHNKNQRKNERRFQKRFYKWLHLTILKLNFQSEIHDSRIKVLCSFKVWMQIQFQTALGNNGIQE